jgi:uncharacterized protein YbjT (DUF2867 family)
VSQTAVMRIAVAGASGLVGRALVGRLRDAGHDVVEVSRSAGVDVGDGEALQRALGGVDTVVDVLSTGEMDRARAVAFFETTTNALLNAEAAAGVGHHLLLSIVNVDGVEGNAHYAGKRAQEQAVIAGAVPWTILRATQFMEFPATVVGWMTSDGVATLAPLLLQPVAVADVADELARLAAGPAQGRATDLAGPDTHDFVDMARRTLAARGDGTALRASWRNGPFPVEMAGEVLLAGPDAKLGPTSFDDWLAAQ